MNLKNERLLYLPHENPPGGEIGPRSAFEALIREGGLASYEAFSLTFEATTSDLVNARARLLALANTLQPTIVLWSHPKGSEVTAEMVAALKNLRSSPTIVLQEMDPWGMVHKRIEVSARILAKSADLIYLCGTGSVARLFRRAGGTNIRYTPHGFDSTRFGSPWSPTEEREFDVVMIANRNRGRFPGTAVTGAWRREQFAKLLERQYGPRFALYGHGWDGLKSWKGPIDHDQQGIVNRSAWVSATWDHFPAIENYTSDRVPISLASGVPHVTNYKRRLELAYPPGSGLYWGGTVSEVKEMVGVVLAMPRSQLMAIGEKAAKFARVHKSQEALTVRLLEDVSAYRSALGK